MCFFKYYHYTLTIRELEDPAEKRTAIEKLAAKYAPESSTLESAKAIDQDWNRLCMPEMTIDHITGKEAIELARKSSQDSQT
ncbi:hypothetical protein D1159_12390 [Pseudoflavonifractor sp. 524-17]|uniref:pyridoxamine 5'-phosphate oxidase family protein n=1 Tax=Pseudoflavonifractor sp. 524-17 TaxID=2304577 RepID=UPI00137A97F0|nr:pyridoxamine 5'-phosphate oxidase family protein [Pseudoflavonifractor sp. 524-17]NCE65353.1 hypothetical protein [Pseudoflavonifractor sp. 524-17]